MKRQCVLFYTHLKMCLKYHHWCIIEIYTWSLSIAEVAEILAPVKNRQKSSAFTRAWIPPSKSTAHAGIKSKFLTLTRVHRPLW